MLWFKNQLRFSHVAAVCCLLSGCASGDLLTQAQPQAQGGNVIVAPVPEPTAAGGNPNTMPSVPSSPYTTIGRFDMSNPNAPIFSLLSSRIGATFTGTSLAASMLSSGTDLFNVVIDGNTPIIIKVAPSTVAQSISIATGLANTTHTVWMTKRTEFVQGSSNGELVGTAQFFGFQLAPGATFGAAPKSANTRRIEFSGDSGFAGFGADQTMLGGTDYCSYTPETQNADKSIPAYTGGLLGADIVNNSSSGQGVYDSVYDSNPAHLLPKMWTETTPAKASPLWNFASWTPDAVVISAGGDDLWGAPGTGYFPDPLNPAATSNDPNAFIAAYDAWAEQIRASYPRATIVLVLSQSATSGDITNLGGALQQVVAARNAAQDANVFYYDYFTGDPNYQTYDTLAAGEKLYWGCAYHPSAAGSAYLATRLATFLAGKLHW